MNALPSYQVYGAFDLNWETYTTKPLVAVEVNKVLKALSAYHDKYKCTDKIASAWYYASQQEKSEQLKGEWCDFLYFWIGKTVYEKLEDKTQFGRAMRDIYGKLGTLSPDEKCGRVEHSNSKSIFDRRKAVFDYWNNHGTIEDYVKGTKGGCGGKYAKYLDGVITHYEEIYKFCSRESHDAYCIQIDKILNSDKHPNKLKSQCGGYSSMLPSEGVYSLFNAPLGCEVLYEGQNKEQGIVKKLEQILKKYKDIPEGFANEILQNFCYACWMNEKNKSSDDDNTPCYFLFFWIGHKIWDKLKTDGTFGTVMNDIYKELKTFQWEEGQHQRDCINIYPDIMEYKCKAFKNFFDYEYNIKALKSKPNCNGHVIDPSHKVGDWSAQQGYTLSCGACGTTTNEYCKKFREEYIDTQKCNSQPKELPEQLTCPRAVKPATAAKPVAAKPAVTGTCELGPPCPNPNQAGSSGSFGDAHGHSGGEGKGGSDGGGSHRKEGGDHADSDGAVVPAVSGGLAAVGLPTILAFLFYKYKPFFLRKHNHSGNGSRSGSRRKKRSTFRHELNTLTDDDDNTSTETYSRTNLTETATEYSVPYIR
ncbi:KIR protein [Plasmodium coatneyi]|uniref:KIR protein n=1 Tax=Plasmodium coatneyi TaxID=208452 RepID=A0A1B1DW30_9APIC|nr:KIR protein [Plasmodium coatneyi]ANQ06960.1 KIR protein [Plasmodium coatneyi]